MLNTERMAKSRPLRDPGAWHTPELELISKTSGEKQVFDPVYPSTEKLNKRGLDSKNRRHLIHSLLGQLNETHLPENLPHSLIKHFRLCSRYQAYQWIHYPANTAQITAAKNRLIFEEFFFIQFQLLQSKLKRQHQIKGFPFDTVGNYFHSFYKEHLPFTLTDAQKRVLKEIRSDLGSGAQMNRLLQGDVGSGKTIVAFLCMLLAIDNSYQVCLMAPTEILAQQHFQSITKYCNQIGLEAGFLSGNIKGQSRKDILESVENGTTHILIGTHALLEDPVRFQKLGLAITDEQHRFGVEQRSRLWKKNPGFTATYPCHDRDPDSENTRNDSIR